MRPGDLVSRKQNGHQIIMLTAWDSLSAGLVEAAGADAVLVGDSLAMVALGYATTLPVTLEQMLWHTQAVCRGLHRPAACRPFVITDLPFLSYQCGQDDAVAAAGRLLKESGAAAVKLEGAEPEVLCVIDRLVRMGIPVMGHLGLTPQSVHQLGYRKQASNRHSRRRLERQALELEMAGCFAIVLEHVPGNLSSSLRRALSVPLIGIGAGEDCDGQVRVTADLIGLTSQQPPFSPALIPGRQLCIEALQGWVVQQHKLAVNPTKESTPPKLDC